ncbi:C-type lectin domain family 6 member A-like [Amphiprion ocellaris]|uniref:C-type lectin domain family 6 member A-like n=1 Tax=Amphiprion ocellaris TaxID=80972 RepID=UPI002410D076|nr:C-type lectin domain family 6 member A-like [Amphiprion ocellaris]
METEQYVNVSADSGRNPSEGRENTQSETGRSKVYKLVGVSFGLLCIIQSALNVALRLETTALSNNSDDIFSSNVTLISSADISTLPLENDRLVNNISVARNPDLISVNEMLNVQLQQLRNENSRLMERLLKLEQRCPVCDRGWTAYMSSCYQLSTEKKNWNNANDNCISKGAHLLIINDEMEKDILHYFGVVNVWIGLRRQQNVWTWVDKSLLDNPQRIYPPGNERRNCVITVLYQSNYVDLSSAGCREPHYWVCEKEQN